MEAKNNKNKPALFTLIGIFNTLFDLVIYVIILDVFNSIILANIISTSAALIGSYFLNSKITFSHKQWSIKNFLYFMAITIFGLWIIQTGAIIAITAALQHTSLNYVAVFGPFRHLAKALIPKLLATAITLVWNYLWYSKVIFKNLPNKKILLGKPISEL